MPPPVECPVPECQINDLVSEHRALNTAVIEIGQRLIKIDMSLDSIKDTLGETKDESKTLRRRVEGIEKEQERYKILIKVIIGLIILGGGGAGALLKILP